MANIEIKLKFFINEEIMKESEIEKNYYKVLKENELLRTLLNISFDENQINEINSNFINNEENKFLSINIFIFPNIKIQKKNIF